MLLFCSFERVSLVQENLLKGCPTKKSAFFFALKSDRVHYDVPQVIIRLLGSLVNFLSLIAKEIKKKKSISSERRGRDTKDKWLYVVIKKITSHSNSEKKKNNSKKKRQGPWKAIYKNEKIHSLKT